MGGTLEFVLPTITLKPAFAKPVLLTPGVKACSAPEAIIESQEKKKAASAIPVNFSGNSGLKGSTSASAGTEKNRSL